MTLPKLDLSPTSGDDRGAALCASELAASGGVQLVEVAGADVGQRMAPEPAAQVFDGVDLGRVRRQIADLDLPVERIQVVAHRTCAMLLWTVLEDQQRALQVGAQGLQKLDDLFLLDAAVVQPEHEVGVGQAGDHRDVVSVEVKLDHWRLAFRRPGSHPRRSLAQARLVDEDHRGCSARLQNRLSCF